MGDASGPGQVESVDPRGVSRRWFLQGAAFAGVGLWLRAYRVLPAAADQSCPPPPGFPSGVELYRQAFENWSGGIVSDDLWTCAPKTPEEVVLLANWALQHGYRLRPRGSMHGWSPLSVESGTECDSKVIMVDTTQHLTKMSFSDPPGSVATVTAQAGVMMDDLLAEMEERGFGFVATPAPGDITVGGVIAIDAHGAAVPAVGEQRAPGQTYGSLTNLVTSMTFVAWDPSLGRYRLRTVERSDPEAKHVLVHLGRLFVTEATMQMSQNARIRCVSRVDLKASEIFAAPGSPGRTFGRFVEESGRVEVIWFPFTQRPWLKVWSVEPTKPLTSRKVNEPYNYPFSDNIPPELEALASSLVQGNKEATPTFGRSSYAVTAAGLAVTGSADIWGWSKNVLLYIKPTTMRVSANGYAIVTRRDAVQRVVHEFVTKYLEMLAAYEARGEYPVNMPVEIRVTGLDRSDEVDGALGAEPPVLSAVGPDAEHPDRDVAVWLDLLTLTGTEGADAFYSEMEEWIFANYASYASVRPEWSKGWAYTPGGAWTNEDVIATTIPDVFRAGRTRDESWDAAVDRIDKLDPHHVFSNGFLDGLVRRRGSRPRPAPGHNR